MSNRTLEESFKINFMLELNIRFCSDSIADFNLLLLVLDILHYPFVRA